jgi:hypothetical protein
MYVGIKGPKKLKFFIEPHKLYEQIASISFVSSLNSTAFC